MYRGDLSSFLHVLRKMEGTPSGPGEEEDDSSLQASSMSYSQKSISVSMGPVGTDLSTLKNSSIHGMTHSGLGWEKTTEYCSLRHLAELSGSRFRSPVSGSRYSTSSFLPSLGITEEDFGVSFHFLNNPSFILLIILLVHVLLTNLTKPIKLILHKPNHYNQTNLINLA